MSIRYHYHYRFTPFAIYKGAGNGGIRLTKVAIAVFVVALTTFGLAACSSDSSDGKGGTLIYLEYQAYDNLYPPDSGFYPNSGVINNITSRLTYQDPESLKITPWVATKWEINNDATKYTFHLRDDVTFSDGSKVDAKAVAANFDLYGKGDSERGFAVSEQINNYKDSQVVDDKTVVFNFSAPAPGFLQATSTLQSGLLAPKTLEGDSDQFTSGKGTELIGSGPFLFTEEEAGVSWTLKAREDYNWAPEAADHQGRAILDEIYVEVHAEDSYRVGALTKGDADYVRYVQAFDEKKVEDAGLTLYGPQTRGANNALSLHYKNKILQDINVRRALLHGINVKEVIDNIYTSHYPQATSPLSQSALGYVNLADQLTYDPKQSKQLLDQAGWKEPRPGAIREKNGQKLTLVVSEASAQPRSKDALTLIAQQLTQVGIDFQILAADAGGFAEAIKDPEKVAVQNTMVGRADYDVIKSEWHSENRNVLLSDDKKLDRLLELVASTPDEAGRAKASADAQRYLIDNAYVIPLFEEPQVFGAQSYVKGVKFDAVARPDFYDTWLDK